jgi:hypothetical protein
MLAPAPLVPTGSACSSPDRWDSISKEDARAAASAEVSGPRRHRHGNWEATMARRQQRRNRAFSRRAGAVHAPDSGVHGARYVGDEYRSSDSDVELASAITS